MKINYNFVTVLGSFGVNQVLAQKTSTKECNVNNLVKPEHFTEWDCNPMPSTTGSVPPKTKCYLICEEGWIPNDNRPFHRCKKNGEWNHHRDLYCIPNFKHWIDQIDKNTHDIATNTAAIAGNKNVGDVNGRAIALNIDHIGNNDDNIMSNQAFMFKNREFIMINNYNITETDNDLQEYFDDLMRFNAIQIVDNTRLNWMSVRNEGGLILTINGNEGFACDIDGKVDQHTADVLCKSAGWWNGAESWRKEAPPFINNRPINIGDIFCESWAEHITQCTSSGWGDLRESKCKSYDDALYLKCYPNVN